MRIPATFLALFFAQLLAMPTQAAVEVVVETKIFHIPGKGPRVEVNMAMIGGTMAMAINERGFRSARVEAITIVERDGAIIDFAKTIVEGMERTDSLEMDLLHQEFFDLAPGDYELTVELRDLHGDMEDVTRYRSPLAVGALPEGIHISDVLFAERIEPAGEGEMAKYGYRVVPLISDYYPRTISTLDLYAEIYGTDKVFGEENLYLLTYQLENMEKGAVVGAYKRNVRAKARSVEPVIASFDIASLPSGNYLVAIEVRDQQGQLIARRDRMLQRNNPVRFDYDLQAMEGVDLANTFTGGFTNADTLAEFVRCLRPIADPLERKIIDDRWKDRDLELMQRFFYSFWANRDHDPERAWREYREQVVKVNRLFGCRVLQGHETDRGRVYLKYGAPNSMMDRLNEMDALPYSIWHYYRAGRYTNRRFVFYQPSLASNCMELIHSEVPGELNNPRWNQIIHSRNNAFQNVDPMPVQQISGDRAREFFELPR
ncbi:MAG: GWxTD domain-containing protein [Flavobacteriales bacterium]|nr:GWxTD domain-containing protein [Flavobacteriales bacterium]